MVAFTLIFVGVVGCAAMAFFIVAIIAVLKAASDTDDMAERIQHETMKGLERRDGKGVFAQRGSTHVVSMGEDNRNQQGDDTTAVATGLDNSRRVDGGRT